MGHEPVPTMTLPPGATGSGWSFSLGWRGAEGVPAGPPPGRVPQEPLECSCLRSDHWGLAWMGTHVCVRGDWGGGGHAQPVTQWRRGVRDSGPGLRQTHRLSVPHSGRGHVKPRAEVCSMRQRCTEQVLDVRYWGAGEGGGHQARHHPSEWLKREGGGGGEEGYRVTPCVSARQPAPSTRTSSTTTTLRRLESSRSRHWSTGVQVAPRHARLPR
jgi:hypothetical protein